MELSKLADINSLKEFSTTSHPLWDVPVAPFGDKGTHIAFSKESPRVQIDGELSLEQMETIVEYMKSRQY